MKLSQFISLAAATAGTIGGLRTLQRRGSWEAANRRVAICLDYDDVHTAAIRAGLPFAELVLKLYENGATHISLPELTLARLIGLGQLTAQAPSKPLKKQPPIGHWNYLHGSAELITQLLASLNQRLPQITATTIGKTTLAFAGSLPAIDQIGLGFDEDHAREIREIGLELVPRPVSYDWPDPELIDHTLHSAGHIADLCAFAGDWVLGHEMQLHDTLRHMRNYNVAMVYFAETRHQRGDWFIAKGRVPNVVLGHRFTADEMMGMDYHAAAEQWVHFAHERGVRMCYVNFFRVLHATEPLEGVHYVHHLKHALEDAGFTVSKDVLLNDAAAELEQGTVLELNSAELALTGLSAAAIGSAAINNVLNLPESLAVPLVTLASIGAAALPFVEASGALAPKPHSHGEHDHGDSHDHAHGAVEPVHAHGGAGHSHDGEEVEPAATSFAPKLIALAATTLAPIAGLSQARQGSTFDWLLACGYQEAAAIALATATTGAAYQLAVEEYRAFGLDLLVPLLGAATQIKTPKLRLAVLITAVSLWVYGVQNNRDLLNEIDAPHAEGHTHHVSVANRIVGDLAKQLGLRPARKWAGIAPAALALTAGDGVVADVAAVLSTLGSQFALESFRVPQRSFDRSMATTLPSWIKGSAAGLLLKLIQR